MEGVNHRDRRSSLRLVADLEHLDRSGLDSIRLSCCDHGWSGIERLDNQKKTLEGRRESHSADRLARSPLVYDPDVHSSPRQPVRTHEAGRAGTDDEDVYVGLGGHGRGVRKMMGGCP